MVAMDFLFQECLPYLKVALNYPQKIAVSPYLEEAFKEAEEDFFS